MKGWTVVLRKELYAVFSSSIAYIIIALFLLIVGYFFFSALTYFALISFEVVRSSEVVPVGLSFTDFVWSTFFLNAGVILVFMTPLLTMRSFSEEMKQGTLELLYTYPISEGGIVFGKFFGLCLVFLIMVIPTLSFVGLSVWLGIKPDYGVLILSYSGLLLLGISFLSLGLFMSSLTENQVVSASVSFGVLLLFWILGWASNFVAGPAAEVIRHLSIIDHVRNLVRGLLDTRDVIFFLLFISFFLLMTAVRLETRNWRGLK